MLQSLDINLEQGWRQRELVLLLPAWVELSEPADRLPVQAHPSRAPWMKRWVRSRLVAGWPAAEQRLQIAFDIEEIHGALRCTPLLLNRRPERRRCDADRLTNPANIQRPFRCLRLPQVNASYLEHPNPGSAPVQVVTDVLDQPAEQR